MAGFSRYGWIIPVGKPYRAADGRAVQDFRIRYWHPLLWWQILKTVRISRGSWLGGKS